MWYVIQVRSGNEADIVRQCQLLVKAEVLLECFIPYYEEMKRYRGQWHKEKGVLFPGYVFLVTEQVVELFHELKKVPELTKLLGVGNEIVPLNENEVDFLKRFGKDKHLVEVSQGFIVNDRVVVTDGPLAGNEGLIKRIDRHKRKAYLEIPMFGRLVMAQVGLEVVEKR